MGEIPRLQAKTFSIFVAMEYYRSGSHTRYDLKIHIVWITKYRKPVLYGQVAQRLRDLVREICKGEDVHLLRWHVSKDHVHLFVSKPPRLSESKLFQRIKCKTSYKMMREFKTLQQQFWGRHLWARGYFVASSGNVTDEVILEYIKNQDKEGTDDNFQIGREWHLSVRLGFSPLTKLSPFRRLVNWL